DCTPSLAIGPLTWRSTSSRPAHRYRWRPAPRFPAPNHTSTTESPRAKSRYRLTPRAGLNGTAVLQRRVRSSARHRNRHWRTGFDQPPTELVVVIGVTGQHADRRAVVLIPDGEALV